MGAQLSLQRYNLEVVWAGHPGLQTQQVIGISQALKTCQSDPSFFILHFGGNDIGFISCKQLCVDIKQTIVALKYIFPTSCLIWSCILPRLQWRYSSNTKAMEKMRERINRTITLFILKLGGKAIKHPDFNDKSTALFSDSCHLSFIGNDIFLNTLQGALETFYNNPSRMIYPSE